MSEIKDQIELLERQERQAVKTLELIAQMEQYPEAAVYVSSLAVNQAIEMPYAERAGLLRFCRECWQTELNKAKYFLEKYHCLEKGGNCE